MAIALGIETSCDDCSVSLVTDQGQVLFLAKQNQNIIHKEYGGIVPELASRHHGDQLLPLIHQALKKIPLSLLDLIAVTNRPGLLGSLLVGCVTAKSLSLAWEKALIGVNHIEAHIFSPFLFKIKPKLKSKMEFPCLAFVVSGAHSSLFQVENIGQSFLIAETRDDAAGEAFDKFARLLGFPWPGGPAIDQISKDFFENSKKTKSFFTKIKTDDLSFSFSGLKSQGQRLLLSQSKDWIKQHKAQLCADYQKTIVDHLMDKFENAFEKRAYKQVWIGGGVSANSFFRKRLMDWSKQKKVSCFFPEKEFCTDNGAMIAFTGLKYFLNGKKDNLEMPCSPQALKNDFFKRMSSV